MAGGEADFQVFYQKRRVLAPAGDLLRPFGCGPRGPLSEVGVAQKQYPLWLWAAGILASSILVPVGDDRGAKL